MTKRPEWIRDARYIFLQTAPWTPTQKCLNAACIAYDELLEQLQAERREEWREGIVNVLDHEGNYLGCMGSESWQWTLDGGIKRMKEQFDALLQALHKIDGRNPPGAFIDTWGTVDIARRAIEPHVSNPASEPDAPAGYRNKASVGLPEKAPVPDAPAPNQDLESHGPDGLRKNPSAGLPGKAPVPGAAAPNTGSKP